MFICVTKTVCPPAEREGPVRGVLPVRERGAGNDGLGDAGHEEHLRYQG